MIVLGIILVLIVLVILFTLQLISKHAASDKLLVFFIDKRTQAKLLSKTDDKIEFSIDVPYENQSRDEGIFLDAFVRIYLPDAPRNGKRTAEEALLGIPDVEFALYVERRGRMELFHNKENILLTREELQKLLK